MVPRAALLLVPMLCAGTLVACTSVSPGAVGTPSAAKGTLSGVVRLYGGPMNPTTGKMALNGDPGPDQSVRVLEGSRQVSETTSDGAGRFTFVLPAGTYSLACGGAKPLVVVAGTTVSADCMMAVP